MDFIDRSGPSGSNSRSDNGGSRKLNTLAREGIVPVKEQKATSGSKFGQAAARNYCASDQRRSISEITESPMGKSAPTVACPALPRVQVLPRELWSMFGDGWSQLTSTDSGKRTKYGLHCVVESAPRRACICCYEPHVPEVYNAVMANLPQYDIGVSIKAMKTSADRGGDFCLLVGFQSGIQYLSIRCDTTNKIWTVEIRCEDGDMTLAVIPMDSLRCNCFYDLLLQVRGDSISLDVNSSPLFTAVRIPEALSIGGLIGVLAIDSKFAMKGWKFRAIHAPAQRRPIQPPASPGGDNDRNTNWNSFGIRPPEPSYSPGYPIYSAMAGNNSFPMSAHPSPVRVRQEQQGYSQRNPSYSIGECGGPVTGIRSPPSSPPQPTKKSSGAKSLSELMGLNAAAATATSSVPRVDPREGSHASGRPSRGSNSAQPSMASFILNQNHRAPPNPPVKVAGQQQQFQSSGRYAGAGIGSTEGGMGSQDVGLSNVRNKMNSYLNGGVDERVDRSEYTPVASMEEMPVLSLLEQKFREASQQLYTRHDKNVVDTVMRDVIQRDLGVTFDDIAAVPVAKRLLHEAVILPLIMPEFFTGIREPWKGVLLFGPPGTGKTMLAKAVAGVNGSTFFSCSAASLISKYRGESEKIIKCLFEAARLCAPSIIFMDEVDALVATRGAEGEHEASRRLKTELFSEMDGIASSSCQSVMLLATTNCPWDLDEAMRRRLEKRIYIPLPDEAARAELFQLCMRSVDVDTDRVSPNVLANSTNGYSGADIRIICRDAAMMPMRRLLLEKRPDEIQRLRAAGELYISKVQLHDFMTAIQNTSPSVSSKFEDKYLNWDREYGSR